MGRVRTPCALGEGPGGNRTPWSEWITVPAAGLRWSIAMPSALVDSAAVGEESMDQPTTRRLHTSSTTAQYTLPSRVGCSVMSVTHSWLVCSRLNFRSTRSVEIGRAAS